MLVSTLSLSSTRRRSAHPAWLSAESCPLWPHLLVDVNNRDKQKEDHYKIIQGAQHTAQRPRMSLQWGGQGHGSTKSTHSHPQEKQPHQAAHVPQPSHQQEQEERCITQVVLNLERKR